MGVLSYGTLLRDSSHIITLSARHLDAFAMAYPPVRTKAVIIPAPSFVRNPNEDAASARRRGREMLGLQEHERNCASLLRLFISTERSRNVETLITAFGQLRGC